MPTAPGKAGFIKGLSRRPLALNVATNYLAVVWLGGLTLSLIPWYTRRLSSEQWGLVAVCMSLQGLLSLLDAGLSQIMPRDIARTAGDRVDVARTYRLFARAYFLLAATGLLIGQVCAPWIASDWLHISPEISAGATLALRIVLLQFFFQFSNNANIGYWNGTQKQTRANASQCLFATAKHASAVALIALWQPTALSYLLPFAAFTALEFLFNRRSIVAGLAGVVRAVTNAAAIASLARETGVLAAAIVMGMLISQVDRLVLSGAVDISAFGRYVVVANLGLAFMQLQYPLVRAFLPKFVAAGKEQRGAAFRQMGVAIVVMCVLPAAVAAVFAPDILRVWIGDPAFVAAGSLPLRLILAAVAMNSIYQIFYQKFLLAGRAYSILAINTIILVLIVPFSALVTSRYGTTGGGLTWLAVSTLQLLLGHHIDRRHKS